MTSSRHSRLAAACRAIVAFVFISGRAILDYSGTHPSPFDSSVTRRLCAGETSVHMFGATFAKVAGYPALPRAARIGVTVPVGGN
jgi:hypothetical protein